MIHSTLNNNKGMSLVWGVLTLGLIAIFAGTFPNYLKQVDDSYHRLAYRNSISTVKENIMAMLDNDAVWEQMVNNNPSLSCLRTSNAGTTCPNGTQGPLTLYYADGSVFSDPTNPNSGFTLSGQPCTQFDPTNGHNSCVIRYTIYWSCLSQPCTASKVYLGMTYAADPKIQFSGRVVFKSTDNKMDGVISTSTDASKNKNMIQFTRGLISNTKSYYCNSINGIFDQKTETCHTPRTGYSSFDCRIPQSQGGPVGGGPRSWLAGVSADGTPLCQADDTANAQCPNGSAAIGYDSRGTIICGSF